LCSTISDKGFRSDTIAKMGERGIKVLEEQYNLDIYWNRISKMYEDVFNN